MTATSNPKWNLVSIHRFSDENSKNYGKWSYAPHWNMDIGFFQSAEEAESRVKFNLEGKEQHYEFRPAKYKGKVIIYYYTARTFDHRTKAQGMVFFWVVSQIDHKQVLAELEPYFDQIEKDCLNRENVGRVEWAVDMPDLKGVWYWHPNRDLPFKIVQWPVGTGETKAWCIDENPFPVYDYNPTNFKSLEAVLMYIDQQCSTSL